MCVVNGGQQIDSFKQVTRFQNARHKSNFYVENTLYYIVFNTRIEFDKLKSMRKTSTGTSLAKKYSCLSGADEKVCTLVQTVNKFITIPMSVIQGDR